MHWGQSRDSDPNYPNLPRARPKPAGPPPDAALTIVNDRSPQADVPSRLNHMRRHTIVLDVAIISAIAVLILAPETARAQMRRSPPPHRPSPSGAAPKGIPPNPPLPYAGVWDGLFRVPAPDGTEIPMPVVMIFDVADSAKLTYSG